MRRVSGCGSQRYGPGAFQKGLLVKFEHVLLTHQVVGEFGSAKLGAAQVRFWEGLGQLSDLPGFFLGVGMGRFIVLSHWRMSA